LNTQRNEKQSGNGVFFTDERITAQIIELIDAGSYVFCSLLRHFILRQCSRYRIANQFAIYLKRLYER
jgi:hypothetical protein